MFRTVPTARAFLSRTAAFCVILVVTIFGTGCQNTASRQTAQTPGVDVSPTPAYGALATFSPSIPGGVMDLTNGPNGNVWFTTLLGVGRITPSGTITQYSAPSFVYRLEDIITGPDHNLWCVETQTRSDRAGFHDKIAQITPAGKFKELTLPQDAISPYTTQVSGLVGGRDGYVWYTASGTAASGSFVGKIGRITPSGSIKEFKIPTQNIFFRTQPSLIANPDGSLWFPEELVKRIPPGSQQVTLVKTGVKVGRITPSGRITEFRLPITASYRYMSIVGASDSGVWFATETTFGHITPAGAITTYHLPGGGIPYSLTTGPDDNLWYLHAGKVGRITLSGVITEFLLPTVNDVPTFLTPMMDNSLWFLEARRGSAGQVSYEKVARITLAEVLSDFPLSTLKGPLKPFPVIAGPDNNLWFAENTDSNGLSTGTIGRITA